MNSASPSKLLVFIVAYNAETTIEKVITRIPEELFDPRHWDTEILVIDDASPDQTFSVGHAATSSRAHITFLKNPNNLGYGGNQKLGYRYAIEHGFDYVALIHGDGQYAPEELPRLLKPLVDNEAEVVFGSRMLRPRDALAGGMPRYKFVGNKVLTFLENKIIGTSLSEWHSGYRLYSVAALAKVPFRYNADQFDFDTDIIIQMHASGARIAELPIPTFYGDEICHVNGVQYALKIIFSCLLFRLQNLGIFYQSKFDVQTENAQYESKFDFTSSHSRALETVSPDTSVLNLGCGPADLVKPFVNKGANLTVVDEYVSEELDLLSAEAIAADINEFDFARLQPNRPYDTILALDIIEHLRSPEEFLQKIRQADSCIDSELVITTPNVTFAPLRFMFALGFFNYGKRGILDKTHTRLFTYRSLKKLLHDQRYQIIEIGGVPAPFPLAVGRNPLGFFLLRLNEILAGILPGVFSYQIFVRARPLRTVEQLLEAAKSHAAEEVQRLQQVANSGQTTEQIAES